MIKRKIVAAGLALILALAPLSAVAVPQASSIVQNGGAVNNNGPSRIVPRGSQTGLVTLHGRITGSTGGNYLPLSKLGGATGQYQVTAGKTLYCSGFWYKNGGAPADPIGVQFGYGTAALAAYNTATAPTGNNPYGFSVTMAQSQIDLESKNAITWVPIPMTFPASSYPYYRVDANYTIEFALECEEI